jgi:hypothetical protein
MRASRSTSGFNLWHVARWDDLLLPGLAQQVPPLASKLAPPEQVWTRTSGSRVIYYWEHAARHLGMVEALRGLLGESASARDLAAARRLGEQQIAQIRARDATQIQHA